MYTENEKTFFEWYKISFIRYSQFLLPKSYPSMEHGEEKSYYISTHHCMMQKTEMNWFITVEPSNSLSN